MSQAFPVWVRQHFLWLVASGMSSVAAGRRCGVSEGQQVEWLKVAGMKMRQGWQGGLAEPVVREPAVLPCPRPSGKPRLTSDDRVLIQVGLAKGLSMRQIARELGVAPSTVSREIARGTKFSGYRADRAQQLAISRRARPKTRKLDDPWLRRWVVTRLNQRWSPRQIAIRSVHDFPGRKDRQVSHEAIYQALYVQGATALRHELSVDKALRSGRTGRIPHSKLPRRTSRPWLAGHHISTRPPEVTDRALPGHWEGDLVISAHHRGGIITLVERATRYALIRRLPGTRDSTTVVDLLIDMATALPTDLIKTLTWDQGSEMAQHARFTMATNTKVYFCDPRSPWQRGSNENTNGLIRDFWPKNTNFSRVSEAEIHEVQHLLNTRPRETLDAYTPAEKLNALLLAVANTD